MIPVQIDGLGTAAISNKEDFEPASGVNLRPEHFGAKGDYNPDTDMGADDSAAFQAMFDAMGVHDSCLLSSAAYLIEADLFTPQIVAIIGNGLSSQLWGRGVGKLLTIGNGTNNGQPTLKDFAILGGDNPGDAAISAYSLTNMDIDIYVGGAWGDVLSVKSGGVGITSGGGIQTGRIAITTRNANQLFSFAYAPPNPVNVINNQGWSNGVSYRLDIGSCSGNGLWLRGSYDSANPCTVEGSFQGVQGTAVLVETMPGVSSTLAPVLRGIYCEGNGEDIKFINAKNGVAYETLGDITLINCENIRLSPKSGAVTIGETCKNITLTSTSSDSIPLDNKAHDTVVMGWSNYYTPGDIRTPGGVSGNGGNVIINGDARRFIPGGAKQWWGFGRYYVAEKCGDGQADTTRTNSTPFCAKVSRQVGWGATARYDIWQPDELVSMIGRVFWVSLKAKTISGAAFMNATHTTGGDANVIRIGDSEATNAVLVENGFYRHIYLFKITEGMLANGCSLDIRVPQAGEEETVVYISEMMGGWGTSAPQDYIQAQHCRRSVSLSANGTMISYAAEIPISTIDPIAGTAWNVGDIVYNESPSMGEPIGWVFSPGWRPFAIVG